MKKVIVAFAAAALVGSAQAVLVDSFNAAGGNSILAGTYVGSNNGGGIIGGNRDYEMIVVANPLGQFFDVSFGGGLEVTSNGFLTDGDLVLQYDGGPDAAVGVGGNINNLGTGALAGAFGGDRVRIWFLGNDLPVNVQCQTRLGGAVTAIGGAVRGPLAGPGFLDVMMNPAAMAAADSLTIKFDAQPSGDYALGRIETVPEPATMSAIAFGLAAMARRRKKA